MRDQFRSTLRPRAASLALAAAFALPEAAFPLGLGKIAGDSGLGQPLQIEIPLTGSLDTPIDNTCISVRRPVEPIDPEYFPRDVVARIDKQPSGTRLLVATRSVIRQPFVEFRVVITCGYNLSRDYVLAVSPPERAVTTETTASVTASTRPVAAPAAPTLVTASSDSGSLPDGVSGRSITLDQEMTLEQLARRHFPGPLRQERFMRWVAEANSQYFANAGNLRQQRLAAGTQLIIPAGVPPRRPGDHQDGTSPLDRIATASAARAQSAEAVAKPTVRARAPAAKGSQDRLVVGSGGGNIRDYKEAMTLVQRLTGMMEQQVAVQSANDEKIRALEIEIATLKNSLAQAETATTEREAQIRSEVLAMRQAQEQLAEHGWWQVMVAIVGGGLIGAGLLQGLRLLGRRKEQDELPRFEQPAKSAEAEKEAPSAEVQPAVRRPVPASVGATSAATSRPTATARTVSGPIRKIKSEKDPLDFTPPSFLQGEARHAAGAQSSTAVVDVAVQEAADPATAAIELANIMTSMGLTESAAQTLVEHIRENPRQSLQHWLKLLELHRINGKREEFERSSQELRQHFNVQAEDWAAAPAGLGRGSLETYPHIRSQVAKLWNDPASSVKYLHSLLMDNRDGTRTGFPLSVAEEILLLVAIQSDGK